MLQTRIVRLCLSDDSHIAMMNEFSRGLSKSSSRIYVNHFWAWFHWNFLWAKKINFTVFIEIRAVRDLIIIISMNVGNWWSILLNKQKYFSFLKSYFILKKGDRGEKTSDHVIGASRQTYKINLQFFTRTCSESFIFKAVGIALLRSTIYYRYQSFPLS